jgi:hypothetical protein
MAGGVAGIGFNPRSYSILLFSDHRGVFQGSPEAAAQFELSAGVMVYLIRK